jgi:CheY-like chemotaxis protein
MILDAQPDIEIVGETADGLSAVTLARELRPDVCLFDIRMPHLDGVEATRRLAGPDIEDPLAVVVITTFDLDEYVHGALKAGAKGFLLKDAGLALLPQAIHAAAKGDALIAPNITHGCSPSSPTPLQGRRRRNPSSHSPAGRKRSWSRSPEAGPTARSPTSSTSASARSRPTSSASCANSTRGTASRSRCGPTRPAGSGPDRRHRLRRCRRTRPSPRGRGPSWVGWTRRVQPGRWPGPSSQPWPRP